MATASERQERFRQRRLADGCNREAFWLEPSALSALAQLRSLRPGTTRDQIVNQALIALLDSNNLLATNSTNLLATNSTNLLEDNATKPLATNADMPVDRAALATLARSWRVAGMTLDQISARLNERGWTPSAIPAKRTTADQWTAKTLSQLLNRDCKANE